MTTALPLTQAAKAHLTTLETRWSSSLHLRMLSAPLRKCIVTNKILPSSLMCQLKAVSLPPLDLDPSSSALSISTSPSTGQGKGKGKGKGKANQERVVMLPDQILHPKHAPKKRGKGCWVFLDTKVYEQLQKKASYKAVHSEASLVPGMDELIWQQLGERVVQEVEVLQSRFPDRKRLDFFVRGPQGDDQPFSIRLSKESEGDAAADKVGLASTLAFSPRFKDSTQALRFHSALQYLSSGQTMIESGSGAAAAGGTGETGVDPSVEELYQAKRSHLTAPLGVALYRLNMWTSSLTLSSSTASQKVQVDR